MKTLYSWMPTYYRYAQQLVGEQQSIDFASVLQSSLFRTMIHKAACQHCKQYNTFTTCRSLSSRSLPPFLAVNASVYSEESLGFWQDSRSQLFLQPRVYLHGQTKGIDDSEKVPYVIRVRHSFLLSFIPCVVIFTTNFRPWWCKLQ